MSFSMKFSVILLILFSCFVHFGIWYGEGSVNTLTQVRQNIAEQTQFNKALLIKNNQLTREIKALKVSDTAKEIFARQILGVIGENEKKVVIKGL